MRFLLPIVVMLAPAVSACTVQAQCGCATLLPSVTVTVTDAATGTTVPSPTFVVNNASAQAQCIGVINDAGTTCDQWRVTLPVGHSTMIVSASGYASQTFSYDTTLSNDCCQTGTQLQQLVSLTH